MLFLLGIRVTVIQDQGLRRDDRDPECKNGIRD
jgi:hypothetical protein